jgi:transcriptional regulator of arginine metabolism
MKIEERAARLTTIKTILSEIRVNSQSAFLDLLNKRGYSITQATLSRDLKQLNVGKRPDGNGGYFYVLPPEGSGTEGSESDLVGTLLHGFLFMEFSGIFGVIRTLPGYANSVAYGLDNLGLGEILGTIAGDDTILLIPRDGVTRRRLIRALVSRIPGIKEKLI